MTKQKRRAIFRFIRAYYLTRGFTVVDYRKVTGGHKVTFCPENGGPLGLRSMLMPTGTLTHILLDDPWLGD